MAFVPDHSIADIAATAVRSWRTDDVPQLIKNRENTVFRTILSDGSPAVLRLHRPDYHDEPALRSELDWMVLLADAGLPVPRPIETRDGRRFVRCNAGDQADDRYADMLAWIDGTPLGEAGVPLVHDDATLKAVFTDLGTTMARLHTISDGWTRPPDFRRHAWDRAGLLGEKPFWGRFWENGVLSPAERNLIDWAREKAGQELAGYAGHGDYGLIHADLVRENVLVKENRVHIIDFDDAGFGWRLFDIATALHRNRTEPAYPLIQVALIDGYRRERNLGDRDLAALPLFLLLRSFTYLGWIMSRRDEASAAERQKRFVATACADAQSYLDALAPAA